MDRILVADDEKIIRDVLRRGLEADGHEVHTAQDGGQALELLSRTQYDMAILDINMPSLDGLQLCREIRTNPDWASIPVLLLTANSSVQDIIEGFQAGCDDYMSKPFNLTELRWRVRALLRRRKLPDSSSHLRTGSLVLDTANKRVQIGSRTVQLTPIEFDLLHYLITHEGQVLSPSRLLHDVWDYPPGTGDPSLVRTHIKNLRTKIEPTPDSPVYIQTIPRQGYTVAFDRVDLAKGRTRERVAAR